MKEVEGKIILITGSNSGIGKACAEKFAENGAKLILCSRNIDKLITVAEGINKKYDTEILTYQLDVRDKVKVQTVIDELPKKWQKIDVLINNAGGALGLEKFQEGNTDDWDEMIDSNVKGLLYLSRNVVPLMIKNKKGHVINIGSIAGVAAYPNGAVYCGVKAAVKLISDGLRMDTVDTPIRVTNIQPGMVETDFSLVRFHGDKERAKKVYQNIKALTPEDIADIVFYSASLPAHVQICEVTVTPTAQASATVVHRN
ncbi:TPA: NAD(P)-dependent oxidoreductase [Candidatus Delongbacteria bacterium]|nr:MAG: NAD(P)-dependent oxidoreductase [Candidatus Delongbacteria bacterium GWF2_40_14]HAQ61601.1 NAD(P)-dependent oxidoreductase [Candidatus Delongbacteria bacterium]